MRAETTVSELLNSYCPRCEALGWELERVGANTVDEYEAMTPFEKGGV